ncbi:hypothetical protein AB8S42_23980 [Klebsiella pneumoniae]|uniref:hypothetical protein n=1 Tax=Enterobacteriaceae TaxID=543 RepID=UPI00164CC256|nr:MULTISPECIES: hypothetical protein [Klebsiella]EKZ5959598.1 hypothetical protein [Klebsiella pneumoniae]MCS5939729.1 hypothetical protein [Klebsiella variicola subsp. variicola]HBT2372629.1 hypothetical protein [Klebsiella pneumoniae subsp. pneumoniae]HEJ8439677.1 hypothetical protein [Klebsiella oxytoca]MBC5381171.1 hypothetical protein [Klebsiella variicola]
MINMKHFPLKDILVVGTPVLLFMTLLYSLKSHFPDVVNVIGTLVVFILAPALVALLTMSRGVFMFFAGALVTQALTAFLVYLVSTRDISASVGFGACAIVIYVICLSKYEDPCS